MKKYILGVFLLFLVITLCTCKKYPENTLWFKNIKKIKFFDNVKITSFNVNGVDSMNALNNCFISKLVDVRTARIEQKWDENYDAYIPTFIYTYGDIKFFYSYSKNKKKLNIYFSLLYSSNGNTQMLNKSLFVSETTEWDIIKLDPKGTRKIRTTINDNIYEMQLDPL